MTTLRAHSFRTRSLALICALFVSLTRFTRRRRALCPRQRPARARFAYSGFRRFACLLMVAVMVVQFALFPPEVSHAAVKAVSATAANSAQDARLWWHASGWAARSERFLRENFPKFGANAQRRNWDGKGAPRRAMPKPEPQETQEERNGRVARVDISPREATIAAGQEIYFIAVAYDANNSPVGGVPFDWDNEDEDSGERISVEERGKFSSANGRFSSAKEGNYRVKARFGGIEASAKVKVKGVRHSSGQQPIGTRTVSSRDLPQPSRSSLAPPATKDRIAKNAPGRFATRYSSAGTRAMPRLLLPQEDEYSWNSDNFWSMDDPGKERGDPPGRNPDGGAGSGNFQFAAPVLSLGGRGQDLNFGLSYNSRVWHKANSAITFDIDLDWPAPGWSLGFGKVVGMGGQNGYMIIEPDGTRRPYTCSLTFHEVTQAAVCKTTDGSFIDYKVIGDTPANGGAPQSVTVHFPNGTEVFYGNPANNAVYATLFWDRNGNTIVVSYRNNDGPQIDRIVTMGRVIQFYYDSNNLPVAITGPGLDGTTRTLMRITYDWKNLRTDLGANYGFSGLTPRVRNDSVPIVKAIYYPANKTGYWFGDDADSYSAYGMLAKVIQQRGMDFSAAPLPDPNQPADPGTITPGLMTRQMVYDYQMAASGLSMEPSYRNMTETWALMDVASPVTRYFVQENASPRSVEITRTDEVKTVMLSHNAPGQWYDGLLFQEETYNPQGALLGKSFVQWEQGECPPPGQTAGPYQYCAPRPSRVETTDERGQRTGKEFSYGPRYNQVTETREYGYGYVSGGANTLLRRTVNQYLNDPNYNDPQPANPGVWQHIFNLVTLTDVFDGNGVRLSRTEYSYDQFRGTAGLMNTPGVIGFNIGMSPYVNQPNYDIYNLDSRGNVTTIKRYADAVTLDEDKAVVEIRHYDITGNVRKAETNCCMQTTINYTLDTQYAWPESQISGSPSDENKQNTASATFDFNTGLVMTSTGANGRESPPTEYDPSTLRPVREISLTGAYNHHIYDDVAMTVIDFAYEAGLDGPNFASRVDKFLDGRGRVIKEVSFGKAGVQDIVEVKYDQLGRLSQQSRPYRVGMTPLWSTVTYDFLDRPEQTIAPNNSGVVTRSYNQPDPPGSSDQPGETIKVTDPWGRQRWARSDALGRMVEVAEPDPGGNGTLSAGALFTAYTYDALDRLVQVNQGAQTRSFRHDSLSRLTHQKLAERDATLNDIGDWVGAGQWSDVFTYDNRSNLTRHVDARGVKTIFKYEDAGGVEDPLNRLLAVEYDKGGSPPHLNVNIPLAPNVSYAYMTMTPGDKRRVQNVDFGMGNETMSYDSEGRLSQVVQTFTERASYPLVTNYIWDSLDRLKESAYPQPYGDGAGEIRKKVEPAYDVASRIESLKFGGATYASEPVYNAASQTTSLKVGSEIVEKYEYDPKTGLLTNQKVMRGTTETFLDLKYNYTLNNDANNNGPKTGQLTGITDLKNQARNRAYEYDKLGRLGKVKGGVNAFTNPTWNQTYSYDRYGNRSLVQYTELAMAPVNPGSQSRSDLIGKVGQGAGGAANRIFSVDDPFAALGINEGYGSIAADSSDSDNSGTPVRGGPRVYAEEYSNAPPANVVGKELLAERPAGTAPSAPQKEYGNRRGRGLSIVTAQSVSSVSPTAYQSPDPVQGGSAVSGMTNNGHGDTELRIIRSTVGISSGAKTCLWRDFQNVSGMITSITLKFDYMTSGGGSARASFDLGYALSVGEFAVEYSLNGGSNWIEAAGFVFDAPVHNGPDSAEDSFGSSGTPNTTTPVSISIPLSTPISQIRVRDRLSAFVDISESARGDAQVNARVENIRLEVVTDTTPPVISNVAAGGITSSRATITWATNENSDSQVEYRTNTGSWQPTPFNSEFGTTHSKVLTGLTAGTVYHYRVKSRDASGNLAISGDYTFTTDPLVISHVVAEGITSFCVTITWNTNVPTDSQVEYGTTTAYGQFSPEPPNPALVTAHSQYIPGLTPETVYHYRVKSRDEAGNLAISPDFTFTTGLLAITIVAAVNITTSSATINWTTSVPTDSQVAYGTTPAYGKLEPTTPSTELATEHSVVLTSLTPGTLYYYTIKSRDAGGNLAYCGGLTFTTAQSVPTDGLASLSYDDANNRIDTAGFEYDPHGNQTRAVIDASGTQQQYRYDCAGRLAEVLDANGATLATYKYGAGNQRLVSVEGGVTTYFAWAGGKIIAEYEAWGTNALVWKKSYVYLGGRLLATTSGAGGTETRFHHPDRLGTRLVTALDGTVVSEQLTMPFGTMLPFTQNYGGENSYQNPTLSNPSKKRFTSYDRSDATGLDYAVNRFYSPQQGRFTQVDPIEMDAASLSNPQTLNMYAYCGNDPINHVDPDGLFWGAIGRFFKAIGIAIANFFSSGSGGFSGPGFRTPPTFPGSLPGITAARRSGLGGFRTPPFVNGFAMGRFQQTQDDSWGAWWEKVLNKLSGNGYKTNREVEDDRYRAKAAKQKEAVAWLRAHGIPEEFIGGLSADEQIALYERAQRGETTHINIVTPGQPPGGGAPTPTPLPPHPNAGKTLDEILKTKKGSIKQAELPKGTPSWESIGHMKWEEIDKAAKAGRTGFKTIKKLLEREKYNK